MAKIEIMAPVGNFACLTAAAQAGAGAVYFGIGNLNMRAHSAQNFKIEDLPRITAFCAQNGMHSYLTLNTILYNKDIDEARRLLHAAAQAGISAVIASDMAAIGLARAEGIEVHISTQLNISNIEALRFYARFADVMVLARELSLPQIREIAEQVKTENICGPGGKPVKLELFCHGALCMAVSGKCYLSLHEYNFSANRGSCLQVCRRAYRVEDMETGAQLQIDGPYIMSPKDLCTIEFLDKIAATGIEILKIEGRARPPEYVKTVTSAYNTALQAIEKNEFTPQLGAALKKELAKVFNRGFWDGYYQGAKLGEWSRAYGSQATEHKEYLAKVINYFDRIGVAELQLEAGSLSPGEHIAVVGPTTGYIDLIVKEVRLDLQAVPIAPKGSLCSVPVPQKLRRSDRIYKIVSSTGQ